MGEFRGILIRARAIHSIAPHPRRCVCWARWSPRTGAVEAPIQALCGKTQHRALVKRSLSVNRSRPLRSNLHLIHLPSRAGRCGQEGVVKRSEEAATVEPHRTAMLRANAQSQRMYISRSRPGRCRRVISSRAFCEQEPRPPFGKVAVS